MRSYLPIHLVTKRYYSYNVQRFHFSELLLAYVISFTLTASAQSAELSMNSAGDDAIPLVGVLPLLRMIILRKTKPLRRCMCGL